MGCFSGDGGEGERGVMEGGGGVFDGCGWDVEDLVDLVAGSAYACAVDGDELEVLC